MANITDLMDQLGALPGGHQDLIHVLKEDPVHMTNDMLDDPISIDSAIISLNDEEKKALRHRLLQAIKKREHSTVNTFM
jgi:hypothetical protein